MSVMPEEEVDVRALTRWLGPDGARAGLEKSKACTIDVLRRLADKLGVPSTSSKVASRQQLIDDIIRVANRRIDKALSDLVSLREEELIAYFEHVDPDRDELLDLLKEIDASPAKESRKGLMRFAARELSETGRFMRIASTGTEVQKASEREKKRS
jgi:predicted nucleic acid-binding OB-fold protein